MEPITPLTLLIYAPAFLVMLALYGNPFRVFFERYLNEKNIVLDAVERVALTLASGAAVIPLIIMILSLLGNVLNVFVAQILTIFFVLANLYLYKERLKSFKPRLIKPSMKAAIVLVMFSAIFIFHLYPSTGLFVHPGNDPSLYSLITLRVVENGGYVMSWGSFAPQSWYAEKVHLTIAGFSGTAAFFHQLTALSIEKIVCIITVIYAAMISLGVYFLAKRLFKNTGIALCSAFVFGMLIQEPGLTWFGWGGNAELSSLFLLPILLGLFWEIFRSNQIGFRYMLFTGFLLSGMGLLHALSAFYLTFALIPLFLIFVISNRKIVPVLKSLAVIAISIAIISPIFVPAAMAETTYSELYASRPSPVWSAILSWNQSPSQMLYSILLRFFSVYGIGTFLLLQLGITLMRNYKTDKKPLILLVAWALILFLVHENTPTGLYIIPFPLWHRIEVNRIFTITSFSVSIITGIILFKTLEYIQKGLSFKERNLEAKVNVEESP